jgi:uncharacterized protein HemY
MFKFIKDNLSNDTQNFSTLMKKHTELLNKLVIKCEELENKNRENQLLLEFLRHKYGDELDYIYKEFQKEHIKNNLRIIKND